MRAGNRTRQRGGSVLLPFLITLAGLIALVAVIWVAIVDDPDGGEPVAVALVEDEPQQPAGRSAGVAAEGAAARPMSPDERLDLVALPVAPGRIDPAGAYAELVEPSEFGPLPRIGRGGLTAMDAYGRRPDPSLQGLPRVVVVIGGMGISQTGTERAIDTLPEGVTLAFAPYGASLQRWVDKARGEGHEVLLQVPLEPIDFPATDPGEHTLLVADDPEVTDTDLKWSLGRMTSYTGVMNYMGARFTGDPDAVGRLLTALAGRGLLYLDDGSSPMSRASEIGARAGAPVLAADLVIDAERNPDAIDAALAELERLARTKGVAVGTASAFQVSVDRIAAWAREARSRGIAIVSPSSVLR